MATMQCRRTSRHLRPSGSMSPESGGARFDGAVKRTARRGHGSRSWLTTSFPNPHPSSLAKRALCRQTPKVGAVCGKAARTDLCGGRAVMDVPTAILPGDFVVAPAPDALASLIVRRGDATRAPLRRHLRVTVIVQSDS